jgi:hypothetical protein
MKGEIITRECIVIGISQEDFIARVYDDSEGCHVKVPYVAVTSIPKDEIKIGLKFKWIMCIDPIDYKFEFESEITQNDIQEALRQGRIFVKTMGMGHLTQ